MKVDGVTHRAHRVIWECAHGPIPEGMIVMHTCDNPPCVRVDHLVLGTHNDNMADMVAKGRQSHNETKVYRRGDEHPGVRLSDEDVRSLRTKYEAGGTTQTALAREFKVSQALVSQIVRGLARASD
jgi:hypothetical protein